jgi:sugar lactone lactonase YvrE
VAVQEPGGGAAGNIYVLDTANDRVQKFTIDGEFLLEWGQTGTENGQFQSPRGIAVDAAGNVWVSDTGNHRVQKFDGDGNFLLAFGSQGAGDGQFESPLGLRTDPAANAYVADSGNHRVQKFSSQGVYQSQWGSFVTGDGQFDTPVDVAVTAAAAFVSDSGNDRVQQFTLAGVYQSQWGTTGTGDAQFDNPGALVVAADGTVFVCDTGNNRVQSFAADRAFQYAWGVPGTAGNAFDFEPGSGIAISSDGHLHVADAGNARLQRFHPDPDSLTFHGAFADVQTTLTIDPATWNGLTGQEDGCSAAIVFTFGDGPPLRFVVSLSETTAGSCIFRVEAPALIGGNTDDPDLAVQSVPLLANMRGGLCGGVMPIALRMHGIVHEHTDNIEVDVNSMGLAMPLASEDDGWIYTSGGSKSLCWISKTNGEIVIYGFFKQADGTIEGWKVPSDQIVEFAYSYGWADGDIAKARLRPEWRLFMDIVTDSAAPLGKVTPADQELTVLKPGLWDQAYEPGTSADPKLLNAVEEGANFVGSDGRRFYIRLQDQGANRNKTQVDTLEVAWVTTLDAPTNQSVTLYEVDENGDPAPDTGLFVSRSLMLVTDAVDRDQPTNTGLGNLGLGLPDELAQYNENNHRTRLVDLESLARFTYQPERTMTRELGPVRSVTRLPVYYARESDKNTLMVQVFVQCQPGIEELGQDPNEWYTVVSVEPGAKVWEVIECTRSVFARIGFDLVTDDFKWRSGWPNKMEQAVPDGVKAPPRPAYVRKSGKDTVCCIPVPSEEWHPFEPFDTFDISTESAVQKLGQAYGNYRKYGLLGWRFFRAIPSEAGARYAPRVVIVGRGFGEEGGFAITDAGGGSLGPNKKGLCVVYGRLEGPFEPDAFMVCAMAHELGHILTDKSEHGGHYVQLADPGRRLGVANLMWPGGPRELGVFHLKRLWLQCDRDGFDQIKAIRGSAYLWK